MGFGGGAAVAARHMLVERRRWLTAAEFTDLLALCQFLPGGNVLNVSVAVGLRFAGPLGSVAALLGVMGPPVVFVLLMGVVYERYRDLPLVRGMFAGLAAAAAGLIVATTISIAKPLRDKPVGIGVALVSFAAIAWLRLPLTEVMLVMAPLSVLLAWRFRA